MTERAELLRTDCESGLHGDGLVLEAQFELADSRRLVWLTDDAQYDEGLHVYLIPRRTHHITSRWSRMVKRGADRADPCFICVHPWPTS